MYVRRKQHRDGNESAIVDALERCGFSVEPLPGGNGVPDLLVSRRGHWYCIEVKNPKGRNKVETTQREFAGRHKAPVHVMRTLDDVVIFAGLVP